MPEPSPKLPSNRSIPAVTVIPVLGYPDVRGAVAWLCRTFGFMERLQIAEHRSQLMFNGGCVVVTERPADAPNAPRPLPNLSMLVRVADARQHHDHARQAGARIITPPTDQPYGERQYTAEDLGGYRWTFSQSIADVDPATWGGLLVNED